MQARSSFEKRYILVPSTRSVHSGIIIDAGVRNDCIVLHVLKHGELVEDVDAKLVDEGIIVFILEQWHLITGDSIGGGIFVVVEIAPEYKITSDMKRNVRYRTR
jgi:hypothetical protein